MRKMIHNNLIALVLMSMLIFSACSNSGNEEQTTDAVDQKTNVVRVKKTQRVTIDNTLEYTGTIEAFEVTHLGAATPGQVEKIYVEVGDKVKKGQLIALFDRTKLMQARIQLATLEQDMKRMDTLLAAGSIAQQKYDQLKAQYDITKTNVEFLERNTEVKSPINGIITGKYIEDGEIFSMAPNPKTGGKGAIVSIMNIRDVKVLFGISEKYFPVLKKGMKSNIKLDIFPEKSFTGSIYRIHPVIDKMTRTFTVENIISNTKELLRPGMFARVELKLGIMEVLIVPSTAVLKQTGTNERYVFVYEDGNAVRKTVHLGRLIEDNIEIVSGLTENEQLIIEGQSKLMDGSSVEIVN
jgi:RND family efflux transporter MFP subunit